MDYDGTRRVLTKTVLLVTVYYLCCSPVPSSASRDTPQQPAALTADQVLELERIARSDERIRALVGPGELRVFATELEPDKIESETFLSGKSETLPSRRVVIIVFNAKTSKAAYALVLHQHREIIDVHGIDVTEVPFSREDAEHALALVRASQAAHRELGEGLERFRVLEPGDEARVPFAAQALPVQSMNPQDPCSVHRCLDLIFRTERGYLSVRAHVDLTAETVAIERGGHHK